MLGSLLLRLPLGYLSEKYCTDYSSLYEKDSENTALKRDVDTKFLGHKSL